MNTLLVTYDLNDEDDDRPPIVDEIKELALDYAQLSESSYAVLTLWTPGDVYRHLKGMIDEDDYIYIITLSKPWAGRGRKKTDRWLKENL